MNVKDEHKQKSVVDDRHTKTKFRYIRFRVRTGNSRVRKLALANRITT